MDYIQVVVEVVSIGCSTPGTRIRRTGGGGPRGVGVNSPGIAGTTNTGGGGGGAGRHRSTIINMVEHGGSGVVINKIQVSIGIKL
jgi:hypothetical protein